MDVSGAMEGVRADRLLLAVAEHLRVPLTAIARRAELGQLTGRTESADADAIRTQACAALALVDSYLLSLELTGKRSSLELEPVSASSMLVDAAHELDRFAKHYQVQLEVEVGGKFGPVIGNPQGLRAALLSLGFSLVEAQAAQDMQGPRRVMMAMHRTPLGIAAGAYGNYQALNANHWRTALRLAGRAQQPITNLAPGSGAGLFVADTILRSMNSRLRVGRYQRQSGLAATLQPSPQLHLV